MAKVYRSAEADLDLIKDRKISVIGYGNQGRSQALNLRDNGLDVIVGNIDDPYAERAKGDGLEVYPIRQAAAMGEIVMLLLPDEITPEVYDRDIHEALAPGNTLCFASGYNLTYRHITAPDYVDLILVAPRMGGGDVRTRYVEKKGFVSLVAVSQDCSGHAWNVGVALAMGIGSSLGALESSFEEETIVDLFGEQLQGMALFTTQLAFDVLVEAGCSPEAALLELYVSEEVSDDWRNCARIGLWKQLEGHSTTSQYGQLTRGELAVGKEAKELFLKVLEDITSGRFAREWMLERTSGLPRFKRLRERSLNHSLNEKEELLHDILTD
jgi:ketol-acid reductoisomerase